MKSPSPFVQKEQAGMTRSSLPPAKPEPAPVAPSPAEDGDKPRFEFYKVLTDKPDAGVATPRPADKPKASPAKPSAQYLQAGSFTSAADAENLKARLAFLGFEAGIQTVTIPDKGVWHRVRLGPYKSTDELGKVRTTLKQNGVDSTPIPAQ
jgi:cell division protein FtsN